MDIQTTPKRNLIFGNLRNSTNLENTQENSGERTRKTHDVVIKKKPNSQ